MILIANSPLFGRGWPGNRGDSCRKSHGSNPPPPLQGVLDPLGRNSRRRFGATPVQGRIKTLGGPAPESRSERSGRRDSAARVAIRDYAAIATVTANSGLQAPIIYQLVELGLLGICVWIGLTLAAELVFQVCAARRPRACRGAWSAPSFCAPAMSPLVLGSG